MIIIIVSRFGHSEVKDTSILPRIGDTVDLFYNPMPKVTAVCLFPSSETLAGVVGHVDALITVE